MTKQIQIRRPGIKDRAQLYPRVADRGSSVHSSILGWSRSATSATTRRCINICADLIESG